MYSEGDDIEQDENQLDEKKSTENKKDEKEKSKDKGLVTEVKQHPTNKRTILKVLLDNGGLLFLVLFCLLASQFCPFLIGQTRSRSKMAFETANPLFRCLAMRKLVISSRSEQ
jgi:hypothetical protein